MGDEIHDNNPVKKRVRKKRKNFLANAKKYAKKGQMGRGARMSEELYQYFVGILEAIKEGIEDPEERVALVNNVLNRTKGEELNVIGNQLGCRVIELLLPFASPDDLERFMEIISPELRRLCSDNFTSHVVETLLRVSCCRATEHLQNKENDEEEPKKKKKKTVSDKSTYSEEHIQKCYDFTIKICKYALNNLEDFVWDMYANHILRSAIRCLSGITLLPGEKPKTNLFKSTVMDDKGIPPHLTSMEYKIVPDEFKELVKEFGNRLSAWPQFKDLPYQNLTSALLQVLLYAMKNVDSGMTKSLVKTLLNESFAPDDWASLENDEKKQDTKIDVDSKENVNGEISDCALPPVFKNQSGIRLLEAALFVVRKKMYTQIYAKCFINRLGQLALMPMLNFTVQRLIDNCQVKEEFEPMFDEVSSCASGLLAAGNSGVLVALAKAALRLRARQAQYIQCLENALKCSEGSNQKYFAVCCLRLLPSDRVDLTQLAKEYFINVHGSVILQTILEFQRPAKAVNSLLELSGEELMVVFEDAKGSHVADALCRSTTAGVKARDKLIWRLKGFYQKLALSKHGSRAFEEIFAAATPEQQVKMMTELAEKSSLMNSTPFGRLVAAKLDVEAFKVSQKKWEQARLIKNNVDK